MNIRKATPHDAEIIQALIEQHVSGGTLLPRTLDFIRHHLDHYLVAELGGTVVACVHLEEYSPSLAEIRSLAVDVEHRGQGLGPALVAAAERLAARRGYPTVFAVSDRDTFFLSLGYAHRHIPELDRERSEVSRFKAVLAKDV